MKAKFIYENISFKREDNPQKSLRIGKYAPKVYEFEERGNYYTIEVIGDAFMLNHMEVRLEFKETDGEETADVYVDDEESDTHAFRMSPFDYEFKEQGEYSEPGYTSYGYPIAKNKKHLEELKEKYSFWTSIWHDYTRTDKNPFVAVAKLILLTY